MATKASPHHQHLGDIVFWQLADTRVGRATLESLWRDAGLDAASA